MAPAETDATDSASNDQEVVVVTFHPQIWKDDHAVTGTNTKTYRVPREDALVPGTDELVPDRSGQSDGLAWHENAPEYAQDWQGPFYVTVEEVSEAATEGSNDTEHGEVAG